MLQEVLALGKNLGRQLIKRAAVYTLFARRCLLSLSGASPFWADVLEGRVVSVADGDTSTLLDSNRQHHRIRLAGIDAPEKVQPFGQRSKQHLSELAFGKDGKADCHKIDRYDRGVCTVFVNG